MNQRIQLFSVVATLAATTWSASAAEIYVTTTDGGIWQYDDMADMAAQTSTVGSGTLVATQAAYGTDQGSTMDASGSVYRVTGAGDIVQYASLSAWLAGSGGVTLGAGVYTGNTAINGVSYDLNTGGFYAVFAGSSATTPGDIVQWPSLADFLANANSTIAAANYTGNILNLHYPDGYATTAVGGAGLNKSPGEAFTASYFQVAGNGRLEGFESLVDYAQNANNRGNITGLDVFGRNTTAFGGSGVIAGGAFAVIPEPSTAALTLLGLVALLRRR